MRRSLLATAWLAFGIAACGASSTPSPSASPSAVPSVEPSATPTANPSPPPSASASAAIYIVKKGDTLYAIAVRTKTTVKAILAANPDISNPNYLKIGQRITIPAPSPSP